MNLKKKIGLFVILLIATGVGKYVYDMHINHNFETITEGKVYKSGVIPPDEIEDYVKECVNYFNNGSDQVPKPHNLDTFFKIMDDPNNYPVLIHCYHGVGRAEMYSAIYRIEYENMDRDEARTSTRLFTKWSSFDLGKSKGDFLHNYQRRKDTLK
jgi:hypothetical protein